jgi:enoyl-CoA hydratase/carnithine racemase
MELQVVRYETDDAHVATVTLNRPEKLNAFNRVMLDEFEQVWRAVRDDDNVHAVVLQAEGERAFSAGLDVSDPAARAGTTARFPWGQRDPGLSLGPKQHKVWKPVVCAVHGLAAGGAFYWINESDIIICSDDAQFFDPHVTYGMTSALEPIGLRWRIPLGEALRWALMGLDERMSAERALQIGLVSEVVPRVELRARARAIAETIAAKHPAATQGTVKAIWESLDVTRSQGLERGLAYTQLGNAIGEVAVDRASVQRPTPSVR